jgi:peroxisomal coenzyme A diphosphatase NUDT7
VGDDMNLKEIELVFKNNNIGIIGEYTEYRRYGVVVPLVEIEGELNILFEVRAKSLRSQPGEISFPGGRIEACESSLEAAVRETCEEIGLCNDDIKIIGATDILITPHNRLIYPYVAEIKSVEKVNPSKDEVDHVFYVPLTYFIQNEPIIKSVKILSEPDDEFFPYSDMKKVKMGQYKWDTGKNSIYFYRYGNYVIWGITAKIVYNFIKTIEKNVK